MCVRERESYGEDLRIDGVGLERHGNTVGVEILER